MLIDKQTLSDLDIFKPDETALTVFALIDKTKTAGGRYRLREKLFHPPQNIEDLMRQQDVIKYLSQNPGNYKLPFSTRQIKTLELYLSSNIEITKKFDFFTCAKFYLTDINAYKEIKQSILEVVNFIATFKAYITTKMNGVLPQILENLHDDIFNFAHNADCQPIIKKGGFKGPILAEVLKSDMILRTELKPALKNIVDWYYELEALLSMAGTVAEHQFNFPSFTNDQDILFCAEGLFHPLLANPVPYSIELKKDSNFIFLTGPNMAGKTTFLKSAGIAIYLAHLGMGIPARTGSLSYFDRLFTSINIPDEVLKGYSYFLSEVKRVKELAELLNSGERVFSLFDELFRGTNVKDAYDATVLIISGLANCDDSVFILSSHLWEIHNDIRDFHNIRNYYFESEIRMGNPAFNYHLQPGVSDTRLGMTIIDNEKIMELLHSRKGFELHCNDEHG
jgi:DNA mismatch repair protein MutS